MQALNKRNQKIYKAYEKGERVHRLAIKYDLTVPRIYQIIHNEKRKTKRP